MGILIRVISSNPIQENTKERILKDLKKIESQLNDKSFMKFVTNRMSDIMKIRLRVKGIKIPRKQIQDAMAIKISYEFLNNRSYEVNFKGGFMDTFVGADGRILKLKESFIENFKKQTKHYISDAEIEINDG